MEAALHHTLAELDEIRECEKERVKFTLLYFVIIFLSNLDALNRKRNKNDKLKTVPEQWVMVGWFALPEVKRRKIIEVITCILLQL